MNDGERHAFIHATRLCRQRAETIRKMKVGLIAEGVAIVGLGLWTIIRLRNF